jgi:hypothetical protein
MKITNKETGPRGLWHKSQMILLEGGQSTEVDLSAADRKAAESTGFFDFGGKPEKKAEGK